MRQDAFHGDDKTSSAPFILRPNEAILHFELPNLLPEGQGLALNTKLGTLALLNNDPAALILARQQFSTSEMRVLLPLLEQYPNYCPDEVLLASFNRGTPPPAPARGPIRWRLGLRNAPVAQHPLAHPFQAQGS